MISMFPRPSVTHIDCFCLALKTCFGGVGGEGGLCKVEKNLKRILGHSAPLCLVAESQCGV